MNQPEGEGPDWIGGGDNEKGMRDKSMGEELMRAEAEGERQSWKESLNCSAQIIRKKVKIGTVVILFVQLARVLL